MLSSYRGNSNATSPQASGKPIKVTSLGAGSGTVSSVDLTAPAELDVTGVPITTTGVIALAWADQSGNQIFASPADGSNGTPSFRALVAADIPSVPIVAEGGLIEYGGTINAADSPFPIDDGEPGVTPPIRMFIVNTDGAMATLEILLPAIPQSLEQIILKRISTDGNEFTIDGNGNDIEGGATPVSDTNTTLVSYTLIFDPNAGSWWII